MDGDDTGLQRARDRVKAPLLCVDCKFQVEDGRVDV